MEQFGAFDRLQLSREGLLPSTGCEAAPRVTLYADSDQRTRETGKALASGLFPTCAPPVGSFPEGTNDPLFHHLPDAPSPEASAQAVAALSGRIGNDPNALTEAYRPQLAALDNLLATCGKERPQKTERKSLFSVPATLGPGNGDHLAELKGPHYSASTLTENLLLAYTEGKPSAEVGWGCVDGPTVRSLIALHTAATDITQRTPTIATAQASNLLDHIRRAMEQAVTRQPVKGAPGNSTDLALFLVGHDTNLLNLAAMLRLNWISDARPNDTAPGGALVFELWQNRLTKAFDVRTFYTGQTLEQMRESTPLTPANPPQRVQLFLPACGRADLSCTWPDFNTTLHNATNSKFVDAD